MFDSIGNNRYVPTVEIAMIDWSIDRLIDWLIDWLMICLGRSPPRRPWFDAGGTGGDPRQPANPSGRRRRERRHLLHQQRRRCRHCHRRRSVPPLLARWRFSVARYVQTAATAATQSPITASPASLRLRRRSRRDATFLSRAIWRHQLRPFRIRLNIFNSALFPAPHHSFA